MLYFFLDFLYVVICIALIFFILIQSNKGMGLSGAFGAVGGSDSVFGASGSMNVLMKITITLAVIFALMSITLSLVPPPRQSASIVEQSVGGAAAGSLSDLVKQSNQKTEDVKIPAGGEPPAQPEQQ